MVENLENKASMTSETSEPKKPRKKKNGGILGKEGTSDLLKKANAENQELDTQLSKESQDLVSAHEKLGNASPDQAEADTEDYIDAEAKEQEELKKLLTESFNQEQKETDEVEVIRETPEGSVEQVFNTTKEGLKRLKDQPEVKFIKKAGIAGAKVAGKTSLFAWDVTSQSTGGLIKTLWKAAKLQAKIVWNLGWGEKVPSFWDAFHKMQEEHKEKK